MNYHIVNQNLTSVKRTKVHHDWHFQATLFGAMVFFMLIVPLTNTMKANTNSKVLGTSTQISERVYDSQHGYYEKNYFNTEENKDIFTRLVEALLTAFE